MNDTTITCPRDGTTMVTYTRAGVQIDQCEMCKGIFLDRGELEQLAQAEQDYYGQQAPPQQAYQPPAYQPAYQYPEQPYYDEHDGGHRGGYRYDTDHGGRYGDDHRGNRRRGFMQDLFG